MTTGWKKNVTESIFEENGEKIWKQDKMLLESYIPTSVIPIHPVEESKDKELWEKAGEGWRSDTSSAKIQSSICCWDSLYTNWWSRWSKESIDEGESISVIKLRFGENVSHPWWKSETVLSRENFTNRAIVRISAALNITEVRRRWTATCWNSWQEMSSRRRWFPNSISLMKCRRLS